MSAMNFSDRVPVRGNLEILYMKGDYPVIVGSDIVIDPSRTQVVYKETGHNLVVDEGRLILNQTMAGELPAGLSADPITYFCTGTGGYTGQADSSTDPNPPTGADMDLYQPLFQTLISSKIHPNSLATTYVAMIGKDESIGDLSEFGLKTAQGRLFCRKTTRPRYKDNEVFFIARWTIQF